MLKSPIYLFSLLNLSHPPHFWLGSTQYYEIILLHQIVMPQVGNGWYHDYSMKTWQVGCANEQSI